MQRRAFANTAASDNSECRACAYELIALGKKSESRLGGSLETEHESVYVRSGWVPLGKYHKEIHSGKNGPTGKQNRRGIESPEIWGRTRLEKPTASSPK